MRGGAAYEMTTTTQGVHLPRSLTGYPHQLHHPHPQHHHQNLQNGGGVMVETSAWACHVIPKKEPIDEERNDSGITSSGSDLQSLSPGSDRSNDIPMATSPQHQHQHNSQNISPYYSTPQSLLMSHYANSVFNAQPLTPPFSEPMASPRHDSHKMETNTPYGSPQNTHPPLSPFSGQDGALSKLQTAFENKPVTSPRPSEMSSDDVRCDDEEEDLRVPKLNSHGKVKKFKCKQCGYIAVTKLDFWTHTKSHIKLEKQLLCPKCPFVTEYKHHLEYHLHNHAGSKPFKCNQCNYTCVNKSMLNSHMKSHSNIYQFNCADCSYTTKYCHSLKLHLRKYGHEPGLVLNPDGTTNPLTIIDVYGTRRGPKMKSSSRKGESPPPQPPQVLELQQQAQQLQEMHKQQLSQLQNQQQQQQPKNLAPNEMINPLAALQMQLSLAALPFFNGLNGPLPNALFMQNIEQISKMVGPRLKEGYLNRQRDNENVDEDGGEEDNEEEEVESSSGALDLSKPDVKSISENRSRRKGRAFKLSTSTSTDDNSDEDDDRQTTMFGNVEVVTNEGDVEDDDKLKLHQRLKNNSQQVSTKEQRPIDEEETTVVAVSNNNNKEFNCAFCDIQFGNVAMYTMHMGFHDYKRPFVCSVCGHETKDKVEFFAHTTNGSHGGHDH